MIYIQLHRFVNDCVKIDIILVLAKKQHRNNHSIITEYFPTNTSIFKYDWKFYRDITMNISFIQRRYSKVKNGWNPVEITFKSIFFPGTFSEHFRHTDARERGSSEGVPKMKRRCSLSSSKIQRHFTVLYYKRPLDFHPNSHSPQPRRNKKTENRNSILRSSGVEDRSRTDDLRNHNPTL